MVMHSLISTRPLSAPMRNRLVRAHCAAVAFAPHYTPRAVINALIAQHHALFGYHHGTVRLRCAGVEITNTGGDENLLLHGWIAKAAARLSA